MGPTTKAISVTGGVTFPELVANFYQQARALIEGGVDLLLIETCQDTRNVKAALVAIEQLRQERGERIAVIVSGTIEATGTMLAGQTAEAFCASLAHADLLALGLNCATGPEFMTDHMRTISQMSPFPVICCPNAGLPNEEGLYLETPHALCAQLGRFLDHGWLNLVGGCCGTTPEHIRVAGGARREARPARSRRPATHLFFRARSGRSRREQPPADCRRAHQRHRLAAVQEPDRGRKVGGSDARSRAAR